MGETRQCSGIAPDEREHRSGLAGEGLGGLAGHRDRSCEELEEIFPWEALAEEASRRIGLLSRRRTQSFLHIPDHGLPPSF